MTSTRRKFSASLAVSLSAVAIGVSLFAVPAFAQDTIKVGVLHSLSGTMAISESTLKDTVLMMIDDIRSWAGT